MMVLSPNLAKVDYTLLTRGNLWGGGFGGRVRVVFVGFRGRVRVGDSVRGVIYNRGKDLFRFFCLFTLPATMATPATPQETSIIGTRQISSPGFVL